VQTGREEKNAQKQKKILLFDILIQKKNSIFARTQL
jgi:hypothetical protein